MKTVKSLCWPVFWAVSANIPTVVMPPGLASKRRIQSVLIIAPPGGVGACMYCAEKAKGSSVFKRSIAPWSKVSGQSIAPSSSTTGMERIRHWSPSVART